MNTNQLTSRDRLERVLLALAFVLIGGAIMVIFKPWGKQYFPDTANYLWRIGVTAVFLVVYFLVRRSARLVKYAPLALAMFILQLALSLDWVFGAFLFNTLHMSDAVPAGWAYPKLNELLVIVPTVLVFTFLSGGSLGSIFIQKGRLKLGLLIGGIAFVVAALGSIPMAGLLFKAPNLTVAQVLPWIPWVLIAVLANGALEEILFRGLFLRKLQPFFGAFLSNFLIALVFTVLHKGSTYTSQEYIFLAVLVPLALVWGWLMQKTDSVWASILFHAGMDIPIFLGIFANL